MVRRITKSNSRNDSEIVLIDRSYLTMRHFAAVAVTTLVLYTSCSQQVTAGVKDYGPVLSISAIVVGGAKEAQLRVGTTVRLNVTAYYARDTLANLDPTWTVRNGRVASNVGSTVTAVGLGQTYVIAQAVDGGRTFTDSVKVSVTSP